MGYFGTRYNQPRLLAAGLLTLSVGSLCMALPHFMAGEYKAADLPPAVCLNQHGKLTNSLRVAYNISTLSCKEKLLVLGISISCTYT